MAVIYQSRLASAEDETTQFCFFIGVHGHTILLWNEPSHYAELILEGSLEYSHRMIPSSPINHHLCTSDGGERFAAALCCPRLPTLVLPELPTLRWYGMGFNNPKSSYYLQSCLAKLQSSPSRRCSPTTTCLSGPVMIRSILKDRNRRRLGLGRWNCAQLLRF